MLPPVFAWTLIAANLAAQETAPAPIAAPDLPTATAAGTGTLPGAAEQQVQEAPLFADPDSGPLIAQPQRWRLTLEGKIRAWFDDNINTQPQDALEDFILALAPSVNFEMGDFRDEKESFVRLSYAPTAFFFLEGHAENTVDHDAIGEAQLGFAKLLLSAKVRFQSLSGSEIDVGQRTNRQIYSAALGARWLFGDKTSADFDLHFAEYDYETRLDSQETTGTVWLNYAPSPKLAFALGGGGGYLQPDESEIQTFEQLMLRVAWSPTEKFTLAGQAGADLRQLEEGDRLSPIAALGVSWKPRDSTELSLDVVSEVRASAALNGRNYNATSVRMKVRQRWWEHLFTTLRTGYTHADYYATSFDQPSDRVDEYFFVRPSVELVANKYWQVELFYLFRTDDSNDEAFGFDNHQIGVEFSLAF